MDGIFLVRRCPYLYFAWRTSLSAIKYWRLAFNFSTLIFSQSDARNFVQYEDQKDNLTKRSNMVTTERLFPFYYHTIWYWLGKLTSSTTAKLITTYHERRIVATNLVLCRLYLREKSMSSRIRLWLSCQLCEEWKTSSVKCCTMICYTLCKITI